MPTATLSKPTEAKVLGWADIVAVLASDSRVCYPELELEKVLRVRRSQLRVGLAEAQREGMIAIWDQCQTGSAIVLTELMASRLGLETDYRGVKWIPIGKGKPTPVRQRVRLIPASTFTSGDQILDADDPKGRSPLDAMIATEQAEQEHADYLAELERDALEGKPRRKRTGAAKQLLRPRLLLGLSLQWPVRGTIGEPCPCCHDQEIPWVAACLICDRFGSEETPKPVTRPCQSDWG